MRSERGQAVAVVLGSIVVLLLIAGLVVGGYQLGWWLKKEAVNRTAKINRQSYEVQQTYREEVLKDLDQVSTDDRQLADPTYQASWPQIRAERINDVRVACDHISRLTTSGAGIDLGVVAFHDKECLIS